MKSIGECLRTEREPAADVDLDDGPRDSKPVFPQSTIELYSLSNKNSVPFSQNLSSFREAFLGNNRRSENLAAAERERSASASGILDLQKTHMIRGMSGPVMAMYDFPGGSSAIKFWASSSSVPIKTATAVTLGSEDKILPKSLGEMP